MTEALAPFLVTVSGQDGPGLSERLFAALAERGVAVDDVEQVRVHGRLLLCVEADMARAKHSRCGPCWRSASPEPAWR
jgi:predicted amino acid-binding ACT domain protein